MKAAHGTTVILAGTLISGTNDDPISDVAITVVDVLITDITDHAAADINAADEMLDQTTPTVLPGLIDSHMHFSGVPSHQLQRLPTSRGHG